jgi:hypothetical protein
MCFNILNLNLIYLRLLTGSVGHAMYGRCEFFYFINCHKNLKKRRNFFNKVPKTLVFLESTYQCCHLYCQMGEVNAPSS